MGEYPAGWPGPHRGTNLLLRLEKQNQNDIKPKIERWKNVTRASSQLRREVIQGLVRVWSGWTSAGLGPFWACPARPATLEA